LKIKCLAPHQPGALTEQPLRIKRATLLRILLLSVPAHAFRRAWLEPLPSLRSVQGLKAHAEPLGVDACTSSNGVY
ncbi:hypothetical protein CSV79_15915, partial [Sporosarcina sp. P13]